jgi:signal transduction histidine kinase/ActR/RegA family two-component response regulator
MADPRRSWPERAPTPPWERSAPSRAWPLDRLVAGQTHALELAAAGAPLTDVLSALAMALEGVFERQVNASVQLLEPDGLHLRHGAAPTLPATFTQALEGMAIGPHACAVGAAVFTRQPVVAEDIARDPGWESYRPVAAAHGLRSCWATPILASSGAALGSFAVYAGFPRTPAAAERDTVDLLTRTAALVIERDHTQIRDRLTVSLDEALRRLADAEAIMQTAATVLGTSLKVQRCAYALVDDDQDGFAVTGNYTNGVASIVGHFAFSQFGVACLDAMRADRPWVVVDSETDRRIAAPERDAYRAAQIRGVVCVPLVKDGRLVAAMAVHARVPRVWHSHEVDLVQQVACRCWESIERSRLARTLHETVEREQRARAEAEDLRHRAEAANRAKDEFLAMLGHELRNPLSPIRTALQLMKLRDQGVMTRERTVIERQVTHLTRLVDDLLDVSRIARGQVDLRHERVEVADVVSRAVEQVSPLLEERGQRLTIDLPDDPLHVIGDPTRLSQVLSNLLTNAAKYTEPGGHVDVSARRDDGHLVLRVSDSGVGIAPEILPTIFERFVQERQASDRAHGGLGLGLAIVKSLVERHGGTITAESEGPGLGSVFEVRLPLADVAMKPTDANEPDASARRPSGRRVLVVDDNEDGAAMLAAVLAAGGHRAEVAHDAPGALEAALRFQPDVALLDIGLPVMDGNELAVRLRQLPGMAGITLVALTGYGQPADKARSRAAGFDAHLVKPVDMAAIDHVLGGRRTRARSS